MKHSHIAILTLALLGCGRPTVTLECVEHDPGDVSKRADWVLACIKNGNPMSDEEGEDLVYQCEQSGDHVIPYGRCVREEFFVRKFFDGPKKRCSTVKSDTDSLQACREGGWKP